MLISGWLTDWHLYKHADMEHEVTLDGVHHATVGRQEIAVVHLKRSDDKSCTMRMKRKEARALALQIENLFPVVIGDH